MNKMLLIALWISLVANAAMIYTVDTDRSGMSSVTLSISGSGTVSIPMPDDASDFRIVGGTYSLVNSTALVQSGETGFTTFSYSSSLLTTKTSSDWRLYFVPPPGASILVYMPPYSAVDSAYPQPKSVSADSSQAVMQYSDPGPITVYYTLNDQPAQPQSANNDFVVIAAILAAALVLVSLIIKYPLGKNRRDDHPAASALHVPPPRKERTPTLELTAGKKGMMETFNENDLKIVNFLLSSSGKARRNEIERKTAISKSSLAMALNRLEKRKIIGIDRGSTTHFVRLSDYFLAL